MSERCECGECGSRQRHKCIRHGGKMCATPSSISMDFERKLVEDASYREVWVEKELENSSEYFKQVIQGDEK